MKISECRKAFKLDNAAFIKAHKHDIIMINEAYMHWLDTLCKAGEITQRQYDNAGNLIRAREKVRLARDKQR